MRAHLGDIDVGEPGDQARNVHKALKPLHGGAHDSSSKHTVRLHASEAVPQAVRRATLQHTNCRQKGAALLHFCECSEHPARARRRKWNRPTAHCTSGGPNPSAPYHTEGTSQQPGIRASSKPPGQHPGTHSQPLAPGPAGRRSQKMCTVANKKMPPTVL